MIEFSYTKLRPESASSSVRGSLPSELRGIQKIAIDAVGRAHGEEANRARGHPGASHAPPAAHEEPGESGGTGENEAATSEHGYFFLSMNAGSRTMATSNSSKDPPLFLKAS